MTGRVCAAFSPTLRVACQRAPHGGDVQHWATGSDANGMWTVTWTDPATIRAKLGLGGVR